jgi:hypothetical protein
MRYVWATPRFKLKVPSSEGTFFVFFNLTPGALVVAKSAASHQNLFGPF